MNAACVVYGERFFYLTHNGVGYFELGRCSRTKFGNFYKEDGSVDVVSFLEKATKFVDAAIKEYDL